MNKINKVCLFDTETVGVRPNYIISLSFRYYEKGKSPIEGEILCNPDYYISPEASAVNGFTNEQVKQWPTFAEQWNEVEPYFRDAVWIGHNLPFDARALRLEFSRYCLPEPHHYEVDTLSIAKNLLKKGIDVENHKLITLCKHFKFDLEEEKLHGSAYDIYMTDKLYRALKVLCKEKNDGDLTLFKPKEVQGEYTQISPPCK